jgi:putative ABC transport system permease protein
MLFLLSVYRGVADGSVEYIRKNEVDLWILQKSATNILRGSSIISGRQADLINKIEGIKTVSPILFILSTVSIGDKSRTIFLTGYNPLDGIGGPPSLNKGREVKANNEIILDKSFAAKFKIRLGEIVKMQEHSLRVVGFSEGTNAFVIQYAFSTLKFARSLIGYPDMATCFLVTVQDKGKIPVIIKEIENRTSGFAVYDHKTFLENNVTEMEAGFLPLLYSVAVIGAVVLTVILSLLLSVNILERRKDFAILKTLGSPKWFLRRLIIAQSLLISFSACIVAIIIFFPLVKALEKITPEISTKSSIGQVLIVVLTVGVISLLSSLISVRKLRRIYLMEVFL